VTTDAESSQGDSLSRGWSTEEPAPCGVPRGAGRARANEREHLWRRA